MANPFVTFFNWVVATWKTADTLGKINMVLTAVTLAVGVKGFMQARQMMAKGQDILANKTSAGGKLPVIYGTRRVGAQIIYMDVSANDSRDLYVVYALSVGECDEILGRTIELDGNPLTDYARFKDGGYIGSDKISSGAYSLNTVSQNGTGIDAGAGGFGSSPTQKYRYVMNLHHGAATQTADPMLVASMPNWTSAHKLNGVCYIAAHYGYDKEGMWKGVPQLTVQVRGKKVFDPRDTNQTFGTVSTYEYSDNPALTFLDYITNNEYGKGLTQSQINMSTFTAAANVCDTQVDQPYFNGSTQSLTWSGNAGDDFITIGGTDPNTNWWQNKIGEVVDINDANGNLIVDGKEIKDVQRNGFYDQNDEYIVYIDDTLGSTYSSQTGSSLVKVKRFHCNGYLDANKNVMDNAKELLANMRGIFLYIDGKYELSIEDTGTSTFSINDNHIIADAGISVDYGNKDKKANKVIVEFFNANKRYELDTATVLHDATPEYYSDDGDEILEIKAEFPYISDPYIAYNMGKAILTRSRNQTTMQFLGTPEMYKLNVGDIVDLTYAGLGFSGKVCRVEALELQSNGLVAVSLIEYFDVYTWEVPPQEPVEELANLPSAYAVKAPTGLSFTDTDSSSTGRPFLSWNEPTDFPNYQYRINVVDSSSNQVLNRIVDVENCDLNFLPVDTNYVASVTSLNTLGTESSPATLTFTIGDAPTATADIKDDAIVTDKIVDDAVTDAKINSLSADKITAGTIDASQITVTNLDADNITSGTIGADKIDVTNLSAISADLGSITAGDMNIGSGNFTVSSSGFMSATGATISGGIIATSLNVTNATVTGTLDASVITLNGDPLDDLFGVSGTGSAKTLAIGADVKNQLKVDGISMQYIAYDQTQSDGDLAFKMDEDSATFYPQVGGRVTWSPTFITGGVSTNNNDNGGITTPNLTVGYTSLNQTYNLAVAGTAFFNAPLLLDTVSTPSTTTNKLYNVGGSLYFNGSAVGGGGTSTTINNNADNRIITGSGTANTLNAESGLTYNGSALSVSGTIIVTGTVDGRDIATDGSKLDGIESGATADQTQAQINALGITAIGLSGSPNITTGTISSGAITANGGSVQHEFISSSDAPLITRSTDASSGIAFTDNSGTNYIFYRGSLNHFYTNSGTLGVGAASVGSGQALNVAGGIGISGTTVISSGRAVTAVSYGSPANTQTLYNGFNGVPMVQGVNGAAYYHGSDNGGYGIVIQGGHPICKSVKIGSVNAGTTVIDSSRNLTNIGTATATQFLASGGDSTPSGTTFNNVFKGVSSYRTAYFDGNGSNCSVWWGVGNNPHAALDTTDGNLATWANDSVGTWRKITEHSASGLNVTTGSLLINGTTVIDSSRNLTNIADATVTRIKVGGNFGNYPISVSSNQKYAIGFRNTGATNGSTNYPWLAHESDKFIIHWNGIGDKWSLDQSGNSVNSGNVTAFSDKRLKTNIQTLDSKKALQMRGVSFIKDGVEGSGVIAQEIEEIAPELVITADDEMGTKSVAYGNLVGYLIETVKDQQKQIDELKQRLDNDPSN